MSTVQVCTVSDGECSTGIVVSTGVRVMSTIQYTLLVVVADMFQVEQNKFKAISELSTYLGNYQGI